MTTPQAEVGATAQRGVVEAWILLTLGVAPLVAVVGFLASIGIGSASVLAIAVVAGGVTGGLTFIVVMLWFLRRRRYFERNVRLRVARPYRSIWTAFALLAIAAVVVSLAAGNDGKAFVCDGAQYCRLTNGIAVRITGVAYLENQGPGAIFLALWSALVGTMAVATRRGAITFGTATSGTRRWGWFPTRGR